MIANRRYIMMNINNKVAVVNPRDRALNKRDANVSIIKGIVSNVNLSSKSYLKNPSSEAK